MSRTLSQSFVMKQKSIIETRKSDYLQFPEYVAQGREIPERSNFKLNKIVPRLDLALEAINKGTYGNCIDCGSEIPIKRLELIPAAVRCVECQDESEV